MWGFFGEEDEDILRDVVGRGGICHLSASGGVDEIDVRLDQLGEGCGISRGCETPKSGLDFRGRHLRALWPTDLPRGHNSGKVVANSKGSRPKAAANPCIPINPIAKGPASMAQWGAWAPAPWIQASPDSNSPASHDTDSSVGRRVLLSLLVSIAVLPVAYRLSWQAPDIKAADKIVTLHYMAWGNPQQLDAERAIINRFNTRYADRGIRVELFVTPGNGYMPKLQVMLASGTAPDIARVDHYDFSSMISRGWIQDLTELAAADPTFNPKDLHPVAIRECYDHGRLYGLSTLFGGITIYYNKDLFRRAGLSLIRGTSYGNRGNGRGKPFDDATAR